MLDPDTFKTIIKNALLVSIDICLVHDGKSLYHYNEPLKGKWFTPGGRILKNEPWQERMRRVAYSELGLVIEDLPSFILMGVWDHLYENRLMDENVSTHYVNLQHYCLLWEKPRSSKDQQHNDLSWFDLEEVAGKNGFYKYM